MFIENPHLADLADDNLHHLGLKRNETDLFYNVKFVCTGGSGTRMRLLAELLSKELDIESDLNNLSNQGSRYDMFKVGPVICVSHGMGQPSLSILLNELFKIFSYVGAKAPTFIRIGTSGGLGVAGGTVVVSTGAVNAKLQPYHNMIILGKDRTFEAVLDNELADEMVKVGRKLGLDAEFGITMSTDDYFEGQGRLTGAFCDYGDEERLTYLKYVWSKGVRNMEMEASCFAAMTHRAGIKAAIVCVAFLDRLQGDQAPFCESRMKELESRPSKLVAAFIKERMS